MQSGYRREWVEERRREREKMAHATVVSDGLGIRVQKSVSCGRRELGTACECAPRCVQVCICICAGCCVFWKEGSMRTARGPGRE